MEEEARFPIGCPVQLKGGGRRMIVNRFIGRSLIECVWEDSSGVRREQLSRHALQSYVENQDPNRAAGSSADENE